MLKPTNRLRWLLREIPHTGSFDAGQERVLQQWWSGKLPIIDPRDVGKDSGSIVGYKKIGEWKDVPIETE